MELIIHSDILGPKGRVVRAEQKIVLRLFYGSSKAPKLFGELSFEKKKGKNVVRFNRKVVKEIFPDKIKIKKGLDKICYDNFYDIYKHNFGDDLKRVKKNSQGSKSIYIEAYSDIPNSGKIAFGKQKTEFIIWDTSIKFFSYEGYNYETKLDIMLLLYTPRGYFLSLDEYSLEDKKIDLPEIN